MSIVILGVVSHSSVGTLQRRLKSIGNVVKDQEGQSKRTYIAVRDEINGLGEKLSAAQISLDATNLRLSDLQDTLASKAERKDADQRVRKALNLMRAHLPETLDAVRKVDSTVEALLEQSSISDRKFMNRLRDVSAVQGVRTRLEQTERLLLGTIEEERLSSADRWRALQAQLAGQESSIARQTQNFGIQVEDALNKYQQSVDEAVSSLRELTAEGHLAVPDHVATSQKAIIQAVEEATSRLRQRVLSHVTQTVRDDTRQVEALFQLLPKMPELPAQLPPSGGFAMDAQALLHLLGILEHERPKLILELGGGTSTIWMGHFCRNFGTKIVSIDHLEHYHRQTQAMVDRHGLNDVVECRLAPLQEVALADASFNWYSLDVFEDLRDIDIILVDGPPESVGDRSRFPALPVLEQRISQTAMVLLDDTHRDGERKILDSWRMLFPEFDEEDNSVSRLGILRRANLGNG